MDSSLQVFIEMRESKRLSYRLMDERDFDFFFKVNSNLQMMKFAYEDCLNTEKEAKSKFYEILSRQLDDNVGSVFVAIDKTSGEKVGIIHYDILKINTYGGIFSTSYLLHEKWFGHGYGTEMNRAMTAYLFNNFNVHKVCASCHEDNKAYESVLVKLGMSLEGINRKARYKDRVWKDEKLFGLLREEWEGAGSL